MTGQMMTKQDFMELMMGVLTAKLNARICHCPNCAVYHKEVELNESDSEIIFIRTIADNIYTFAVADGMNRAFEAMRRDVLPEEGK